VSDTQLIPSPHKGKGAAVKKEGANIMGMWATPKTPTPPSTNSFTSLNIIDNEAEDDLPPEPPEELIISRAKHSYQAKKSNQLSFEKGDELIVLKQQGNWWLCEAGGVQGLAPSNYLAIISEAPTVSGLPSGFISNFSSFKH
jgi:hypothetical protein